jgi:hypothetical protein
MGDLVSESQIIIWIIGQIVVGAAIYGGIRADIRGMHLRLEHSEKSLSDAHERIDRMLERRQ